MSIPAMISRSSNVIGLIGDSMRNIPWVLTVSAICSLPALSAFGQSVSETPPNIVLFFADDLGYGHLGSYGQTLIATPRLDEMAAQGVRMTQFYAGDSWCPASRNALMTGKHTGHTQLRAVGVLREDSGSESLPLYLPGLLKTAGYATGLFGKWGLGSYSSTDGSRPVATGGRPTHLGFDEVLGFMTHRDAHTCTLPPFPQKPGDFRIHDRLWVSRDGETVEDPRAEIPYLPDVLMDAALDFIDRHRDRPFFLYLPSALPHAEYFLPADDPAWRPYLDEQGSSVFAETPWTGHPGFRRPVPAPRATFAAMVSRLDAEVGQILDHLTERGLAERTLFLFLSDNGPAGDAGFESPQFFNGAGNLRGLKTSLYEGGIKVPMLALWPGTIQATAPSEPAALWDLLPTLLDLAGIPHPPDLDGRSLVELWLGDRHQTSESSASPGETNSEPSNPATKEPRRLHDATSPLYWETFNWNHRSQAIRVGQWKAVRPQIKDAYDRVELYNLETDPEETLDLSPLRKHCHVLIRLKELMNASHEDPPEPPRGNFKVPALAPDCAPLFADGFESGNVFSWSSS